MFYLLSDSIWFFVLQATIFAVFLISFIKDIHAKHRKNNLKRKVKRGEQGWHYFIWFWAISIILIEIIISSDVIDNYKIIIGLVNFGIFAYLNLRSGYFQNEIIGWWTKVVNQKQSM